MADTDTDTENWREAEREQYRSIKLSKIEIKALQHFDRNGAGALLTKSDPSRMIVNKKSRQLGPDIENQGFRLRRRPDPGASAP
jgi:hypothetical protein